ncbi:MAG: GH3 auxin-responsive promoter family protein [Bacteroidales bacterium]
MPILSSIINWVNTKRLHQIDLFRKYPVDVQRETLLKLLDEAKDTRIGKEFGFAEIQSFSEFQERVPVRNYEAYKPLISRVMKGEQNLFWPSEIKWFAKSSGTTSDKSKFIPVSWEALEDCHFRGGKDILAIYSQNYPDNKLFLGKGLTLGGSHQINSYSNQSYYGDLSAIIIENLPFWADFIRTPGKDVALMDEWEEKLEEIIKQTFRDNVTSLAGVPSWNLVLIKHILDYSGKENLLEVWPNLELFTHGGVSFTPYREQFRKLIPSDQMHYMEVYNASEGHFAVQDEPAKDDMLLMLDYGIFFEFIPAGEVGDPHPPALTVEEVVPGENYAIVISTNSGLWRYLIGDTVVFTSTFPHKIKISGRIKHFMNAFGEEVIIENAEKALSISCAKTNAVISEYTAAPIYMGDECTGSHEWLIEFEKAPADLDYFTSMLDNALCSINSDYEAKRYKSITLVMPTVRNLPRGTFYKWLSAKGKLGGQHKVPRLSNNRKIVDEVLGMVHEEK